MPDSPPAARAAAGGLALLGLASSGALILGHWSRLGLPGCRGDSPCAHAAASAWATLPLLEWPVASLAFAYFLAWLGLAILGPTPRTPPLRSLARLAALAALFYLAVGVATRALCPYCLVSHAAALGLWALAERARGGPSASRAQRALAPTLALAVMLATAVWTPLALERRRLQDAEELARAQAALREPPRPTATDPLAGRYRLGPADAKVRLVVFTGYQCPDCRRLEDTLSPLLAASPDVSMTVRHFPFCADCNRLARQTIHPNACWAARAAEAAGLLRGPEGFWSMHRWLFSRGGAFTDAELHQHLAAETFDVPAFIALLQSDQTLAPVKDDVEQAAALALNQTPTLFINGVELKAWSTPGALNAALAAARQGAAAAPVPAPPSGPDRLLAAWREQPVTRPAMDLTPHSLGSAEAPVQIVVFGDYQDEGTQKLDDRLRAIADADPRIRYAFRHFPADQKCNPTVARSFHPLACRLARTAEAAAAIGGEDAFWKVHAFILAHHQAYTDADLRAYCEEQGLGAGAILKGRDDKAIADTLADDITAGQALGVTELPWLLVNNRRVPRWTLDQGDILDRLIDEAAK